MKRSMLLACASLFLVLAGCVSTGGSRAVNQYGSDVDMDKVVTVNQWAQIKGATVVWVNLPRKPKAAESASNLN